MDQIHPIVARLLAGEKLFAEPAMHGIRIGNPCHSPSEWYTIPCEEWILIKHLVTLTPVTKHYSAIVLNPEPQDE